MKIRNLGLLLVSFVVLTGCAKVYNMSGVTVKPTSYDKHPVLYEVAYDLDCVGGGTTFQFRKGERFLPKGFSGQKVTMDERKNTTWELPKHSIGLFLLDGNFGTKLYAAIYPNGHFVNERHFVSWRGEVTFVIVSNHKLIMSPRWKNICKIKDGKPLFKKISKK